MTTEIPLADAASSIGVHVSSPKRWLKDIPIPGVRKNGKGAWMVSEEGLAALKRIDELQDEHSLASIRMIIAPPAPGEPGGPSAADEQFDEFDRESSGDRAPVDPGSTTAALDVATIAEQLGAAVAAQVVAVLEQKNQLAAAYGEARHRIGTLEAEVRHRDQKIVELQAEIERRERALPAGMPAPAELGELRQVLEGLKDERARESSLRARLVLEREGLRSQLDDERERAEAERARHAAELQRAEAERARLQAELDAARAKPTRSWWPFGR